MNLHIRWLKQQQREALEQHKYLFMLLLGSAEILLLISGLVVAQVLAGHYNQSVSYSLWLFVIGCNTALALSNSKMLNADFAASEFYLPKQNRRRAYINVALFGMWPMALFLLPSGLLLIAAEEVAPYRFSMLASWCVLTASMFWLHWRSYLAMRLSFRDATIAASIGLAALEPWWFLASAIIAISYLLKLTGSWRSHHWWLAYLHNEKKSILSVIAGLLLLAVMPWYLDEFRNLAMIAILPLCFWLLQKQLYRFNQLLQQYQLGYLPNINNKRQRIFHVSMIAMNALFALSLFALDSYIAWVAVAVFALGWTILAMLTTHRWIATALVYAVSMVAFVI